MQMKTAVNKWPVIFLSFLVAACANNSKELDQESARFVNSFTGKEFTKVDYINIADGIPIKIFKTVDRNNGGTIIVAHSCGGINNHTEDVAKRFSEKGFNSVVVDSFGYRKVDNVCETNSVEGAERLHEIYEAVKWIKLQNWHNGKIFLIGYGHGGKVAIAASKNGPEKGIDKSVAFYPYCYPGDHVEPKIPVQIHMGSEDDWTPAYRCRGIYEGVFGKYKYGEYYEYPGAYHGFDLMVNKTISGIGQGGQIASRIIRFNYAATFAAYTRTLNFFRQ